MLAECGHRRIRWCATASTRCRIYPVSSAVLVDGAGWPTASGSGLAGLRSLFRKDSCPLSPAAAARPDHRDRTHP